MNKERVHAELETIRRSSPDGKVHPEDVVNYAQNETTALHEHFDWDDRSAAFKYRIDQARTIIRVFLIPHAEAEEPVREYVCIERGYERTADVVPYRRNDLALSVLHRMRSVGQNYSLLPAVVQAVECIDEQIAAVEADALSDRRAAERGKGKKQRREDRPHA